ncbi:hypothetical protein [Rhodobium gokarnense]|uniref:Uncharacterized protein n=1 Tax=Rhodobium gokarnense TaxID=364296 RepID=A0ABT3HEX9_9HYPH|nr:hypothetical protein [Rhodobium gokarnense]MCW2308957.1 hypothetical protein [Rhodobium gokarnense]
MPRNEKGEWVPERHSEHTYSEKEREAGRKVLRDFDDARLGRNGHLRLGNADKNFTLTVWKWEYNFGGQSKLDQTARGREVYKENERLAEQYRGKSSKDATRQWGKNDLKKEFEKNMNKNKNNGPELDI